MIVDHDTIFNLDSFKMNPEVTKKKIELSFTQIYEVDNFYSDFSSARLEMMKLPFTKVFDSDNQNFFDGRASHSKTMFGTEPPYLEDLKKLGNEIADIDVYPRESIVFNKLQFSGGFFDSEKNYYNIHVDKSVNYNYVISFVLFMNDHYEEGEGLNLYRKRVNKQFELFEDKIDYEVVHFYQAKPNCGLVFNGSIPHGPSICTDQFVHEPRFTQAIFLDT